VCDARVQSLVEGTALRVGREEDLRVRVDDEHLLSEGRIAGVEPGRTAAPSLRILRIKHGIPRSKQMAATLSGPTPFRG
jgi:hypothetical protein